MTPSPVDVTILDRCRDLVERLNVDDWGFDVFQWSREVRAPPFPPGQDFPVVWWFVGVDWTQPGPSIGVLGPG